MILKICGDLTPPDCPDISGVNKKVIVKIMQNERIIATDEIEQS